MVSTRCLAARSPPTRSEPPKPQPAAAPAKASADARRAAARVMSASLRPAGTPHIEDVPRFARRGQGTIPGSTGAVPVSPRPAGVLAAVTSTTDRKEPAVFRFIKPALVAAGTIGALALALVPAAQAAPPAPEKLDPPPPSFLTCKPLGAGTICSG